MRGRKTLVFLMVIPDWTGECRTAPLKTGALATTPSYQDPDCQQEFISNARRSILDRVEVSKVGKDSSFRPPPPPIFTHGRNYCLFFVT